MSDQPYLRVVDVTKRFGPFVALSDVSLDVAAGEFVCFLGPSGCGKTTLLRAIAGLDIQSEGTIHQGGRDISALPASQRDFGIVFQSYALFPNLTINENVAYGLHGRGMSRQEIRAKVRALLDTVGLADQGDKHPAQLSGGQQQRVALSRALATEPGLLLLDEPLSALDAKVRQHLRLEIKALQRRLGVTTIMVTHDQEEAMAMADRIVIMKAGRIEQVGTPSEVYKRPATAFVADFIGEMNFVPADIVGHGEIRIGPSLHCACETNGAAAPNAATLAIRLEDIVFADAMTHDQRQNRPDNRPDNRFVGEIRDLEFFGSFVRAYVGGEAIGEVTLRADVSANLMRRLNLDVGMKVPVSLPANRLLVYPKA